MSSCVTAPCLLIEGEMKAEIWKKNDPLVADFLTGCTEAVVHVAKLCQFRLVNRQLFGCSEGSCGGYRQCRFSHTIRSKKKYTSIRDIPLKICLLMIKHSFAVGLKCSFKKLVDCFFKNTDCGQLKIDSIGSKFSLCKILQNIIKCS